MILCFVFPARVDEIQKKNRSREQTSVFPFENNNEEAEVQHQLQQQQLWQQHQQQQHLFYNILKTYRQGLTSEWLAAFFSNEILKQAKFFFLILKFKKKKKIGEISFRFWAHDITFAFFTKAFEREWVREDERERMCMCACMRAWESAMSERGVGRINKMWIGYVLNSTPRWYIAQNQIRDRRRIFTQRDCFEMSRRYLSFFCFWWSKKTYF